MKLGISLLMAVLSGTEMPNAISIPIPIPKDFFGVRIFIMYMCDRSISDHTNNA